MEPDQNGIPNKAFEMSPEGNGFSKGPSDMQKDKNDPEKPFEPEEEGERAMWGNQIEFLMSCIATSVGLGNVWRFPFVAYQNGGGAFLIPYIVVLFLIGKPMYYLETAIGQFSSRNSIKVWSLSPGFKGVGVAQAMGAGYILSYYVSIIAICLFYMAMSFNSVLPWAECDPEWGPSCVAANQAVNISEITNAVSSAELYFLRVVLRQFDDIDNGIGAPNWDLTLCLLASWAVIFLVVAQGVKSSGKASYFLALFPYVIMIILLIRAATLEEAGKGILFFLTPQWDKLLSIDVWYAAVTQVFFSLSVCTGAIIMFASYNGFRQNVYRDAMIVTTLDTFTSLMAGITIFGILGNLAHQLGYDNVSDVIGSGGTGLAFISYPDAIAKSPAVPQLFSVLFFLMMFVLGVGSSVALLSCINTVLYDAFPKVPTVLMSFMACCVGFCSGLIFVCPGGQFILEIVDYFGGTFLVLFSAICEIIGVFWVYGLENLTEDVEYMLGIKTSMYWRWCWGLITPLMMIAVFIYALVSAEQLMYGGYYVYPTSAYVAGYCVLFAGVLQVPIFMIITLYKNREGGWRAALAKTFNPKKSWGPRLKKERAGWLDFKTEALERRSIMSTNKFKHVWYSLIGGYRKRL